MSVGVFAVDERIVIDKVFVAGVVGRVDVDYIDFAFVGVCEGSQCFEVVAFDEYMIGYLAVSQ